MAVRSRLDQHDPSVDVPTPEQLAIVRDHILAHETYLIGLKIRLESRGYHASHTLMANTLSAIQATAWLRSHLDEAARGDIGRGGADDTTAMPGR